MIDPHGRRITYLRLSVTDRCDLRCTYCLPRHATFAPRRDLLSIDELDRVGSAFVKLGISKIRLTGGEPLLRKGFIDLVNGLSRHLGSGLDELTLTSNGTQLEKHVGALAAAGVKRINISLDTLDPDIYRRLTRGGDVTRTLRGIEAAQAAGMAVKINAVALREDNLATVPELVAFAHERGMAISFIEVMPVGDIGADRRAQHVPMPVVRDAIEAHWPLADIAMRTGGPARYARTAAGGIVGFITPLTQNFCGDCNRVRVGADGQLHACLGHDEGRDLKVPLRSGDPAALDAAIAALVARKPARHEFDIAAAKPAVTRAMAATGG